MTWEIWMPWIITCVIAFIVGYQVGRNKECFKNYTESDDDPYNGRDVDH